MTTLIRILVAVVTSWLSLTNSSAGAQDLPGPDIWVNVYTYDDQRPTPPPTLSTPERGPTAYVYTDVAAPPSVDHMSHGASARSWSFAAGSTTGYAGPVKFTQPALGARTTQEVAGVASGEFSSFSASRVAAETGPAFFRGARAGEPPSFTPRPNEFKVDPETGLVRDTHGVSVFDNPESVTGKGFAPHEIDQSTIPGELRIIQRGQDPHHYEIVPRPGANLTPERFAACLSGIGCY